MICKTLFKHQYKLVPPFLLLWFAFIYYVHYTTSGFVSTPTSVNATLGFTATFNCSADAGVIGWIVNGSLLTQLGAQDISISQVAMTSVLHVPATEEYNNTVMVCVLAILGGNDRYSDPAVLRVQGMLYMLKV